MLIGEAGEAKAVLAGPRGDVFPIDVGGDVGVTDLLKWGGELSMLGAHLDVGLEMVADVTVIDEQYVAAIEISGDVVDPIERGLVENPRRVPPPLGSGQPRVSCPYLIDQNEIVALKIDGFAGQIDRQRIEQFVGKMDSGKGFTRFAPFHFVAKRVEHFLLSLLPEGK